MNVIIKKNIFSTAIEIYFKITEHYNMCFVQSLV